MESSLRSHMVGACTSKQAGQEAHLAGWVETVRDHGGLIFLHVRDHSGRIQAVADPERVSSETWALAKELRAEDCVAVSGQILERPEGKDRTALDSKDIEFEVSRIDILATSAELPFKPQLSREVGEEQRFIYRYLDLRSDDLQRTLRLRSRLVGGMRLLLDEQGFVEVETPLLGRSTPEGARDFLVPSRLHLGSFYALPQSPQLYKQLLMVGGMDRYYQLARCFRDEDQRANRQAEFTQLDLEMSFVDEGDIYQLVEGLVDRLGEVVDGVSGHIHRMSYQEAMRRFGTDSPDVRFGAEIEDLTPIFVETEFEIFRRFATTGGAIQAICVPAELEPTRTDIEAIRSYSASLGGKEPAWGRLLGGEGFDSTVAKFWSEEEKSSVARVFGGEKGAVVFFMAGRSQQDVASVLGQLRLYIADRYGLRGPGPPFEFAWVERFPMFNFDGRENRFRAVHHPFTRPLDEEILNETDRGALLALEARSYDLVLNGEEVGGGSIRIHHANVQRRVFEILGHSPEEVESRFGFFLRGLTFGAPPHGGIALGVDRLVSKLAGRSNIREAIAFPKNQSGQCLLTGAPQQIDEG